MDKIGKRFEGKVAIVTASTQGIGFGIAERLGLEGGAVVISSRRQNNVDEAVEKLKSRGIEVLGLVCHVSNAQQRKDLIKKTIEALAAEMAPDTRVNCVAPGFVPTHFASFLTTNESMRKSLEEKTLLNRLGTTQDMAAAVAYLASDDASYVTGETLIVAGGMQSRL
ncbi:UNVERIFIED_CONTAM: Short-chain dehydrogenase/reductase SDRA [Sesamum calycinum]|uniref:Short-chain dehydrogenase/reductase SDRA n=1 Tax=Sesamum calycinum TaxID=2727403 RepID=A0AAW2MB64_9LAMI